MLRRIGSSITYLKTRRGQLGFLVSSIPFAHLITNRLPPIREELQHSATVIELYPVTSSSCVHSPTLLDNPTSFPQYNDTAATAAENAVTTSTGPKTVGMIDPEYTKISGSQEIFDSYDLT